MTTDDGRGQSAHHRAVCHRKQVVKVETCQEDRERGPVASNVRTGDQNTR